MHDWVAALIDHGAGIEDKDKAFIDHLSMHEANHPPSGQPLEGGHEGLLKPNQAHFQNVPQALLDSLRASHRGRHGQERVPARRRHLNHVELVLQHLVGQAGHPHLGEGLPIG